MIELFKDWIGCTRRFFSCMYKRPFSALIRLANVKMAGPKGKEQISPKDLTAFYALSQLHMVHCPTLTLPISKDGKYDNLISKASSMTIFVTEKFNPKIFFNVQRFVVGQGNMNCAVA